MIWYISAAFFPCVLVVLFSVLTRSKWVGTTLTLILIGLPYIRNTFITSGLSLLT